jgi:ribose-phosphate pyrophosphokinase
VTRCSKIRIITAAPLLAHAMLNISNESSVSSLFSEESLKPIYEGLYSN